MDWDGVVGVVKGVVTSDAFKDAMSYLAFMALLALMAKLKIINEKDRKTIESGYVHNHTIPTISNKVYLPNAKIEKIIETIKEETQSPDTNRKKVQRAARKLLRGWLG